MSVLDDIRDGKGLKPITSTYCTCQKGMTNIIAHPETNADRIRSMTDEELAEWMAKYCERKTVFCPNFGAHDCQESCEQCLLGWLRTEVTE